MLFNDRVLIYPERGRVLLRNRYPEPCLELRGEPRPTFPKLRRRCPASLWSVQMGWWIIDASVCFSFNELAPKPLRKGTILHDGTLAAGGRSIQGCY